MQLRLGCHLNIRAGISARKITRNIATKCSTAVRLPLTAKPPAQFGPVYVHRFAFCLVVQLLVILGSRGKGRELVHQLQQHRALLFVGGDGRRIFARS